MPARTRKARRGKVILHEGDAREVLRGLPDASVHMVLTDPPYFLDGLDDAWRKGKKDSPKGTGSVGGLPVGMKFDPKQGKNFQAFMSPIAEELIRIVKPGGFFICFSQPRLYHRLAIACEDAGFEIRDLLAWRFTKKAQFKAFSLNHFAKDDTRIIRAMKGRKTPQLRPQFEAMLLAQKPREGTFIDNWMTHKTGLMSTEHALTDNSPSTIMPSTIMTVEKPAREKHNCHLTVKPVALLAHLIELFTEEGQTVLDPFLGSGSTALATLQTSRLCIGIEINPDYIALAETRMKKPAP